MQAVLTVKQQHIAAAVLSSIPCDGIDPSDYDTIPNNVSFSSLYINGYTQKTR